MAKRVNYSFFALMFVTFIVVSVHSQVPIANDEQLASVLDSMVENYYKPNASVSMESFTYAETQLPTSFSLWLEDELRSAFAKTKYCKLFDVRAGLTMHPSMQAAYGDFFGSKQVDMVLYGRFIQTDSSAIVALNLSDLSTGELIGVAKIAFAINDFPSWVEVAPSEKALDVVSSITNLTGGSEGLVLKMIMDKGIGAGYRSGETLTLFVTCSQNAYLKIYHIDARAVAQLIWPNRYGGSGYLTKGQTFRFPEDEDGYKYLLGPPYGTEYIKAIASTVPFATMEADFTDLYGSPQSAILRGLEVVPDVSAKRAEALVAFEIVPSVNDQE
jgi:hypothetical protein